MTDLGTAISALPRNVGRPSTARAPGAPHGFLRVLAGLLEWSWRQWRRREIVTVLRRVDHRLLRDAGIEPCDIETVADSLLARRH